VLGIPVARTRWSYQPWRRIFIAKTFSWIPALRVTMTRPKPHVWHSTYG